MAECSDEAQPEASGSLEKVVETRLIAAKDVFANAKRRRIAKMSKAPRRPSGVKGGARGRQTSSRKRKTLNSARADQYADVDFPMLRRSEAPHRQAVVGNGTPGPRGRRSDRVCDTIV
ncbi:unnamed protein product [Heligmosomoides polygyrus]|uniref:Uncharacterized protein n=1 Tax=Heligmosomoides polygyrus TaxID=6339 RepID=A0A3P7WWU2_HELPZ|nr:unnamed protein product [Heligmosomoides polygyrus]